MGKEKAKEEYISNRNIRNQLTVDFGKVREGPDTPVLTLGRVVHPQQLNDGLEASIVDVSLAINWPPINSFDHLGEHFVPGRVSNSPGLGAIRRDVRQDTGRVITHLQKVNF